MGYRSPTIYEILSANTRPLFLVDLIQIFSVVQMVFVLTPNSKLTPRNVARHIIRRAYEDRGERRSDIRHEERRCGRGVVMHWDCCRDVLPWARSTLASWQVAGDFAARLPARSCEALPCRWPGPSGIPVALAMPWFYSSEAKHLLSHGKSANRAPAKGQTAWMYTLCFTGMNNRHPTHCATREEKKRICRSPEADETLTHVFLCMLLYLSYL